MSTQVSVLVVDGNPYMTGLLQRFLTRQQVESQAVWSPEAAQAVLAQQTFSVVLTDLFAPTGDGLALSRHIQQTAPETRVILMGAFGASELHCQALAAGTYALLVKPFRLQALWDVVHPALQGFPAPEAQRGGEPGGLWLPPGIEIIPGMMGRPEERKP
jgi:DNA-binding NtrC family response regulator